MKEKNIVIVGNGGFAKEVEWLLERINQSQKVWNLLGFIDNHVKGARVIGDDSFVVNAGMELYVAAAIGNTEKRKQLCEKYRTNLIDPPVVMSRSVQMGIGNIICAGCIITLEIEIVISLI